MLFQSRPPTRVLALTESVWSSGFKQLYRTARKVHRHYPMLQWFFAAIALGDAAASALLVLAITYLEDVLEFSGAQNGTNCDSYHAPLEHPRRLSPAGGRKNTIQFHHQLRLSVR